LFPTSPRLPETSGLRDQRKAVQTTLVSNSIEFDGIKIRIIELLLYTKKFNGIPVTHPVLDDIFASLRIAVPGNIRQRIVIRTATSTRSTAPITNRRS